MSKSLPHGLLRHPSHLRLRWNQLRDIGNSALARSSLAIPILGYMLSFNANVVEYLKLHTDFCRGVACGASWRLYFFYFGSCLFALGSLLYAIFCPSLIKKYRDAATFYESEKEFLSHSASVAHLLARIEELKNGPPNDPQNLLRALVVDNQDLPPEKLNYLSGAISELYYLDNRRRWLARITTFLAYVVGGVLLAAPTVVTAIQIFAVVIGKL